MQPSYIFLIFNASLMIHFVKAALEYPKNLTNSTHLPQNSTQSTTEATLQTSPSPKVPTTKNKNEKARAFVRQTNATDKNITSEGRTLKPLSKHRNSIRPNGRKFRTIESRRSGQFPNRNATKFNSETLSTSKTLRKRQTPNQWRTISNPTKLNQSMRVPDYMYRFQPPPDQQIFPDPNDQSNISYIEEGPMRKVMTLKKQPRSPEGNRPLDVIYREGDGPKEELFPDPIPQPVDTYIDGPAKGLPQATAAYLQPQTPQRVSDLVYREEEFPKQAIFPDPNYTPEPRLVTPGYRPTQILQRISEGPGQNIPVYDTRAGKFEHPILYDPNIPYNPPQVATYGNIPIQNPRRMPGGQRPPIQMNIPVYKEAPEGPAAVQNPMYVNGSYPDPRSVKDTEFPDYDPQASIEGNYGPIYREVNPPGRYQPHEYNPTAYPDSNQEFLKGMPIKVVNPNPDSYSTPRQLLRPFKKGNLGDPWQFADDYNLDQIVTPIYMDQNEKPIQEPEGFKHEEENLSNATETVKSASFKPTDQTSPSSKRDTLHPLDLKPPEDEYQDETDALYPMTTSFGKLFKLRLTGEEEDESERPKTRFREQKWKSEKMLRDGQDPPKLTPATDIRDMVDMRDDYWNKKPLKPMSEMTHEGPDSSGLWRFPGYYQRRRDHGGWLWGGYGFWGGITETGEITLPTLTITAILIFTCTHMRNCCWGLCNEPPLYDDYKAMIRNKEERRRCEVRLAKQGLVLAETRPSEFSRSTRRQSSQPSITRSETSQTSIPTEERQRDASKGSKSGKGSKASEDSGKGSKTPKSGKGSKTSEGEKGSKGSDPGVRKSNLSGTTGSKGPSKVTIQSDTK